MNVSDLVAKGAAPLAYLMSVSAAGGTGSRLARKNSLTVCAPRKKRSAASLPAAIRTARQGRSASRSPPSASCRRGAWCAARRHARAITFMSPARSATPRSASHYAAIRQCAIAAGSPKTASMYLDGKFSRPRPPVALVPIHPHLRLGGDGYLRRPHQGFRPPMPCVGSSAAASRRRACRCRMPRTPFWPPAAATLVDLMTGGEDYEVLATVPPERAGEFERRATEAGTRVTCVGAITEAATGVIATDADRRGDRLHQDGLGSLSDSRCDLNPRLTATKSHRIGGIPPPGQFNGIQSSWFGHILAAIEAVGACEVGRMRRGTSRLFRRLGLRLVTVRNQDGFMLAYRAPARLFGWHLLKPRCTNLAAWSCAPSPACWRASCSAHRRTGRRLRPIGGRASPARARPITPDAGRRIASATAPRSRTSRSTTCAPTPCRCAATR